MREPPVQLRYSVPETALILRLSVPTIWRRIRHNQIHVVRDGGRVFIMHDELHRYAKRGTSTLKAS